MEALHEPLPKILRAVRHVLDGAGGVLRETNDADRHDPRHDHRIGHAKRADLNPRGIRTQTMVLVLRVRAVPGLSGMRLVRGERNRAQPREH